MRPAPSEAAGGHKVRPYKGLVCARQVKPDKAQARGG